jgi:hypothetical protein
VYFNVFYFILWSIKKAATTTIFEINAICVYFVVWVVLLLLLLLLLKLKIKAKNKNFYPTNF